MKISIVRFSELGLGCERKTCILAEDCKGCEPYEIAPCVDEDRLKCEMTEEEYDAFKHNRLEIDKGV